MIEERLATGAWWYGDLWSAMDAYLSWVFWRVECAGFDVAFYRHFTHHVRAMEQRPAVIRALEREAGATRQLEAEGMIFTLPPVL